MKRVGQRLLVLVAAVAAAGLAWQFVVGSSHRLGPVETEHRSLPPFRRIVVDGFAEVTLVQGGAESASVSAPSSQLSSFRTEVSDGTLTVVNTQARSGWGAFFGRGARHARVTVTFRDLESIDTSGAVKVRADRLRTEHLTLTGSGATYVRIADLDAKSLAVSGSGAMKVELGGRATEQKIDLSGAADYRAADLASDDARISVSGAGRVVVQVRRTLDVGLSGAASVEYIGNPKVTEEVNGAGRIKRRGTAETRPHVVALAAAS